MYEVYEELLKERGLKTADVCKATGLRQSLFSDWKAGRSAPKIDKLQKIADYFGVSIERFTSSEDRAFKAPSMLTGLGKEAFTKAFNEAFDKIINDDEMELIGLYKRLNEEGKDKLMDYLLDLLDMPKYTLSEESSDSADVSA